MIDTVAAALAWTLLALSGDTVNADRWRGQPLVVHVWATWCQPCIAELRQIERWWAARRADRPGDSLRLVVVSPEPIARVREFVRKRGLTLPFYVEGTAIPAVYGLRTVPSTFFVDKHGRVVERLRGVQRWDQNAPLPHSPARAPTPSL